MVSEQLKLEVEKFIAKHFSFVKFEIYNYFNNNRIYYTHNKPQIFKDMEYTDRQAFEMIDTVKSNGWIVYDNKSSVKYIAGEFRLFGYIYSDIKYKITDIKAAVKNCIEIEKLIQIVKFDPLIKELISEGRHRVKGLYPEEVKYRQSVSVEVGTKVYFCDRSNNIANPAYVIGLGNDRIRFAYFTNIGKDNSETHKLDINGWAVAGASLKEVGLTPEQAIRNRMN